AFLRFGWLMYDGTCLLEHVPVKAPGTPTMYPLAVLNSSARLTLLPGEFSRSSTAGTSSPTLTQARGVAWKLRATPAAGRATATRRRDARKAIACLWRVGVGLVDGDRVVCGREKKRQTTGVG